MLGMCARVSMCVCASIILIMSYDVLLVKGYSANCGERCLAYNLSRELIIFNH